jgi:hypothetical protein
LLAAQVTHHGRDFFQVAGSEGICHVYVDLMNMRVDRTTEETLGIGTNQLSTGVTAWCSCGHFLAGVLLAAEHHMVSLILFAPTTVWLINSLDFASASTFWLFSLRLNLEDCLEEYVATMRSVWFFWMGLSEESSRRTRVLVPICRTFQTKLDLRDIND